MPFYEPETMEQKLAGASYSTSEGVWVDGERVIFGVINKPAGTGSRPHRHPNEQFIFVQQGSLQAMIDGERKTVGAGGIIHIPANSLHSMVATDDEDVIFIVAKDTTWQIEESPRMIPLTAPTSARGRMRAWPRGSAILPKKALNKGVVEKVPERVKTTPLKGKPHEVNPPYPP